MLNNSTDGYDRNHKNNLDMVTTDKTKTESNNTIYTCFKCNKNFNCRQHKWRHEKNCNNDINKNSEIIELKNQNNELKSLLLELLKNNKVHYKTLNKINNNLSINGNSNNVNNGMINNINIIKFGNENINEILNQKEKIKILEARFMSLEESIKRIHFNELRPEYQNILITNLRDDIAYVFDGTKFITTKKQKPYTS